MHAARAGVRQTGMNARRGDRLVFRSTRGSYRDKRKDRDETKRVTERVPYLHVTRGTIRGRRTSLSYAKSRQRMTLLLDRINVNRHVV